MIKLKLSFELFFFQLNFVQIGFKFLNPILKLLDFLFSPY